MTSLPRLYTPRLCLRPWVPADAPRAQELAGDRRVAATTVRIPHPYSVEAAEAYIRSQESLATEGRALNFAITLAGTRTPGREHDVGETGYLIGAAGLSIDAEQQRAELGYWIGVPYWNRGFATEATRALLDYGFGRSQLRRITAHHFGCNEASGRVLQKIGMTCEGTLRSHQEKWGEYHDVVLYGILQAEWARLRQRRKPALAALQPA